MVHAADIEFSKGELMSEELDLFQAMEALKKGKKISTTTGKIGEYYGLDSDGIIRNHKGTAVVYLYVNSLFKIYTPPQEEEIIRYIWVDKKGHSFKRMLSEEEQSSLCKGVEIKYQGDDEDDYDYEEEIDTDFSYTIKVEGTATKFKVVR